MVDPFLPEPQKVAAVRDALPATGAGIYLNTGTTGPLPAESMQEMRDAEDWELRLGRATPAHWEDVLTRMEEARGVLAALVGGDPSGIALTHSTTAGLNIAAWAVDWRPGDRAVTTNQEYPGALGPLVAVRDRFGVDLVTVDLGDGADESALLDAFDAAITPNTRLVCLSHVTHATGIRLPLREIGELAQRRGAWFAVDGAQAAGAVPVDVEGLGCDFYAFPAQKWLLGPEGMGALWASGRAIAEGRQSHASFTSYASLDYSGVSRPWPDARRFEASTFHRPSIAAFARGVGWLEMYVGLEWAHERGARLAARTSDALAAVPGVTVLTPREHMATLVTFRVAGWEAGRVGEELARRVFAIVRVNRAFEAVRSSVAWFNTEEELDRFVETVAEIARHTPETMPRRPSLVVLDARAGG